MKTPEYYQTTIPSLGEIDEFKRNPDTIIYGLGASNQANPILFRLLTIPAIISHIIEIPTRFILMSTINSSIRNTNFADDRKKMRMNAGLQFSFLVHAVRTLFVDFLSSLEIIVPQLEKIDISLWMSLWEELERLYPEEILFINSKLTEYSKLFSPFREKLSEENLARYQEIKEEWESKQLNNAKRYGLEHSFFFQEIKQAELTDDGENKLLSIGRSAEGIFNLARFLTQSLGKEKLSTIFQTNTSIEEKVERIIVKNEPGVAAPYYHSCRWTGGNNRKQISMEIALGIPNQEFLDFWDHQPGRSETYEKLARELGFVRETVGIEKLKEFWEEALNVYGINIYNPEILIGIWGQEFSKQILEQIVAC